MIRDRLVSACIASILTMPSVGGVPPAPPAATPPRAAVPPTAVRPSSPPGIPIPMAADPLVRADLAGAWRGIDPKAPPYVQFVFEKRAAGDTAGGGWITRVTIPQGAIFSREVTDAVVEEGKRFRGSTRLGGITLRFDGALAPDGRSIAGTVEVDQGETKESDALTLVPTAVASGVPGASAYNAVLEAMGVKLAIRLVLADGGALGWVGTADIPAQQLNEMPVIVERADDGVLTVTMPVGVPAVMTLTPEADGSTLAGTFAQGPVNVPISFERSDEPLKGTARPQVPVPPFPYTEREVTVSCEGGHQLAGTLTIPKGAGAESRVPAVVLLTGSGLQDRDEALMGHRPFLVLADALARGGIAVLRCDDRGFGASTGDGSIATLDDFAADGRAMMRFLRAQPEVDPTRCGYVGHSEGGITGPMAALHDQKDGVPVAFVVMLAGPAVPGVDVLRVQVARILAASGVSMESSAPLIEANERAYKAILDGEPPERLAELLAEGLTVQQRLVAERAGVEPPEPATTDSMAVQLLVKQLSSPWMLSFLRYDPAPTLAAVDAPILAINGDLDTQVDSEQNLVLVEKIRRDAKKSIALRRYPKLNHLFQPAETGGVDEYAVIETSIDPSVLEDVVRWIRSTAGLDEAPQRRTPPVGGVAPGAEGD